MKIYVELTKTAEIEIPDKFFEELHAILMERLCAEADKLTPAAFEDDGFGYRFVTEDGDNLN